MELLDFTSELTTEWDAFVADHPLASYGHLSAQFALAAATPGIRNLSLMVRDGRQIAGLLPLFLAEQHELRRIKVRELASGAFFPGGPLVSPRLQGKAEARVIDVLLDGARSKVEGTRADAVVVTHPNVVGGQPSITRFGYSPLLHHGYAARNGVGLLLDLALTAEQLGTARRSGCRQSIAKAQASGGQVSVMNDRAAWLACHDINVQTLGDLAYNERQMAAIWDHFIAPGHATAHAVNVDGRVAAVTVAIHFNRTAYYWIGLNRRPAPLPGAGHLALWTAILAAREQGCTHFELGSLDFQNPKNIGISQFKQSFGGVPYQIISAQFDARPVKTAAIALAKAVVSEVRRRRRPAARSAATPSATSSATPSTNEPPKASASRRGKATPQPAGLL